MERGREEHAGDADVQAAQGEVFVVLGQREAQGRKAGVDQPVERLVDVPGEQEDQRHRDQLQGLLDDPHGREIVEVIVHSLARGPHARHQRHRIVHGIDTVGHDEAADHGQDAEPERLLLEQVPPADEQEPDQPAEQGDQNMGPRERHSIGRQKGRQVLQEPTLMEQQQAVRCGGHVGGRPAIREQRAQRLPVALRHG